MLDANWKVEGMDKRNSFFPNFQCLYIVNFLQKKGWERESPPPPPPLTLRFNTHATFLW